MTEQRILWLSKADTSDRSVAGDLMYSHGLRQAIIRHGVECMHLTYKIHDANNSPGDIAEDKLIFDLPRRPAFKSLFSRFPSISYRYISDEYATCLEHTIRTARWDTIVIDSIAMGWTIPILKRTREHYGKAVYLAHNHEKSVRSKLALAFSGNILKKIALYYDAYKAARIEDEVIRLSGGVVCISPKDQCSFAHDHPLTPSVLAPPGYGIASSRPVFAQRDIILILGSFHWLAKQINLRSFVESWVSHRVARKYSLCVVGDSPPDFVLKMNEEFGSELLNFVGRVDDVQPFLQRAKLGLIIDLVGGGFKLKTLDYAFSWVPIAGLVDAMEGGPLIPDLEYISAIDPNALCDAIDSGIEDREKLVAMATAAHRKCSELFSWEKTAEELCGALCRW